MLAETQNKKFKKICIKCDNIFFTLFNKAKQCNKCKEDIKYLICRNCGEKFLFKDSNSKMHCASCKKLQFECACGCKKSIEFTKYNRGVRYLKGHGRKNKTTSDDHKRKISLGTKGKKLSKEHIEILRNIHLGKKHTDETKSKMSKIAKEKGFGKWMVGRIISKEIRNKAIQSRKGYLTSEKTREKISKANKGINNGMYGKQHSIESRNMISNRAKLMWENPTIRKRILNHPDRIKNCRKGAFTAATRHPDKIFNWTKPERQMANILEELKLQYKHNYPISNIEHKYHADFYISKYNLIIETDGRYWHKYPNYRPIDLIRTGELKNANYNILRFWEDMFDKHSVNTAIKKIEKELGRYGTIDEKR